MSKENKIGPKISRLRELRGMKQEALASALGVSQQTVSNMERSVEIEEDLLAQVAQILGVTPDAIRNFDEESVFNIINNFNDNSSNNGAIYAKECTFNPIDKVVELYERLLEAEKSKVEYLEKLLNSK
ncbi:helix-turn-helix domain-containing protein [Sphingobacterium faecium]|uniref:helix-turn-helix domain-containing protein n=1 Tax=Sphingobacterium faecium TaxID=34087 RepID=UPI0021B67131|nr:helix-turn-helix transcriptional regulator [Sphingobacterium faecium]UXD67818.1 helix-turn-helix domain-containing protein [Sphingobacterium faecium]WGQ15443.1 helix-turn-helix transcriptional regulator [Sphingobacterium faecium]